MSNSGVIFKKGQITIFVILSLAIVAAIGVYLYLRPSSPQAISSEFLPAYESYLSCVSDLAREGVIILGDFGGRIKKPEFVPGSSYMPTSSELNFLGAGIPYWFYVSGNNIAREQVPTKAEMERELAEYVLENLDKCDFDDVANQGYDVYVGSEKTGSAKINQDEVIVKIENPFEMYKEDQSAVVESHEVKIKSKIGRLYDTARKIYELEKQERFLEEYGVDVLRLNAPVTDVEVSCSPLLFNFQEIRKNISLALEENIPFLKVNGGYFDVQDKERNYFVVQGDLDVDFNVNFMYDSSWPTKIEIEGDRIARPVGNQRGLGILGFCYVPYHFVYDVVFPVLVVVGDGQESFQFPVVSVISKNRPGLGNFSSGSIELEGESACKYKNKEVEVSTFDLSLNPVEASIFYKCFDSLCKIGKTSASGAEARLKGLFPACVGGKIIARADGYRETSLDFSSNEEETADILMLKEHPINIFLEEGADFAIITFESGDFSRTVVYPEEKTVRLSEGNYNISVSVYEDSGLTLPPQKKVECAKSSKSGVLGLLGFEEEKCFNIEIPETKIGRVLVGGGKTQAYLTEELLLESKGLKIRFPLFKQPQKIEDLQLNYNLLDSSRVLIDFL